MYQGVYHGSKKHEPDLDIVLEHSWAAGLDKMIVTGGSLTDSKKAIELAQSDRKLWLVIHKLMLNSLSDKMQTVLYLVTGCRSLANEVKGCSTIY